VWFPVYTWPISERLSRGASHNKALYKYPDYIHLNTRRNVGLNVFLKYLKTSQNEICQREKATFQLTDANVFDPHGIFNLLHTRPKYNQCYADKYPVCEYCAVICVGFLLCCMECRHGLAMRILSVCPSVYQTRDLWQNEKICSHSYTTKKTIYPSYVTRNMVRRG